MPQLLIAETVVRNAAKPCSIRQSMKKLVETFVVLLIFIFTSCENVGHCENQNPIFQQFEPNSKEYKNELIQKLESIGVNNVKFIITGCGNQEEFAEVSRREPKCKDALYVRLEGNSLCAFATLLINKRDRHILDIFETESFGYRGAEIKGLRLEIINDSINPKLIYHGMDGIRD